MRWRGTWSRSTSSAFKIAKAQKRGCIVVKQRGSRLANKLMDNDKVEEVKKKKKSTCSDSLSTLIYLYVFYLFPSRRLVLPRYPPALCRLFLGRKPSASYRLSVSEPRGRSHLDAVATLCPRRARRTLALTTRNTVPPSKSVFDQIPIR